MVILVPLGTMDDKKKKYLDPTPITTTAVTKRHPTF